MSLTDQLKQGKQPIDWEQRKYEIAKEIFCIKMTSQSPMAAHTIAESSIKSADALIQKLRGY